MLIPEPGQSTGHKVSVGNSHFSKLLDSLEEAAIILDDHHRLTLLNDAAGRILKQPGREVLGQTILDIAPNPQAQVIWDKEERALETGMPAKYTGTLDYPGNRTLGSKTFIPFVDPDSGRRYLLVIIRTRQVHAAALSSEHEDLIRQLEDARVALRIVLEQREAETSQATDAVAEKLKSTLIPYIDQLKQTHLAREQLEIIELVQNNLNKFVDPHAAKLSSAVYSLSPTEIQVAQYVRDGKTNKEIAVLMRLSKSTILTHRHHIRVKLGLKNKKKNLRTFLLSL